MADRESSPKVVKVRLDPPTGLPTLYATNFVVQHTNHEFILTVYEARPPAFLGTSEERQAQLAKLEEVNAEPLARIVIAATRMPEFVSVILENFKTYEKDRAEAIVEAKG